nr:MAG TPA: hypothetical protein [Caudoviricetes sp.]
MYLNKRLFIALFLCFLCYTNNIKNCILDKTNK